MKPSVFQNIFKRHLKNKNTPIKKMAEDIDPNGFQGYVTIQRADRFGNIVEKNVVKNKLTSMSKSSIIRLLAQEATPWRPGTFNPAAYRINKMRFGNSFDGAYAITNERKYTSNTIAIPSRDINVPIYQDPADLQRMYYNLYEPSVRPGAPVTNNLNGITLLQKKTAYGNLHNNAPKLTFQNIAASQWASGKIQLSLGNQFTNFGLNNSVATLDGRDDINKTFMPPFPNLVVDVYYVDTGKILQRVVFKNINNLVAGASTAFGADFPKGTNYLKPSTFIIEGTDVSGYGNRNMYIKLPQDGEGASTTATWLGGTGTGGGSSFINQSAYDNNHAAYDLLLANSANTLYEQHTDYSKLADVLSKLYFDFSQDSNGNFGGWKIELDVAIGNPGDGIGTTGGGPNSREKINYGLKNTSGSNDVNWAQAKLGIAVSYDRGYYNIINSVVPRSGINNLQYSSNWNSNLSNDALFLANYKNRFGSSRDYYEVGNLKSFTVGVNEADINDFETSFSIIMGSNEGNGADPINGLVYTEAFLCSENDDVFSALRFPAIDRFTKNNQSTFYITWQIRSPL